VRPIKRIRLKYEQAYLTAAIAAQRARGDHARADESETLLEDCLAEWLALTHDPGTDAIA
jgi:hypothetical protein